MVAKRCGDQFFLTLRKGSAAGSRANEIKFIVRFLPSITAVINFAGSVSRVAAMFLEVLGQGNGVLKLGHIAKPGGPVGIVSRSGTLTYQALYELKEKGIGCTTCVGIGGDPVPGTSFIDCLKAFEEDPETKAVMMIGEIGGAAEEEAAEFIANNMTKPVSAYVAGVTAPPGKKMGHAGAIVSGGKGTAQAKMDALRDANVRVGLNPTEAGEHMVDIIAELGLN